MAVNDKGTYEKDIQIFFNESIDCAMSPHLWAALYTPDCSLRLPILYFEFIWKKCSTGYMFLIAGDALIGKGSNLLTLHFNSFLYDTLRLPNDIKISNWKTNLQQLWTEECDKTWHIEWLDCQYFIQCCFSTISPIRKISQSNIYKWLPKIFLTFWRQIVFVLVILFGFISSEIKNRVVPSSTELFDHEVL